MAHAFCRDICLERGEPLVGTGTVAERTILVAWPRGKWRVPRFESVDMSPALSQAIEAAMAADIHVALVDRVGDTAAVPQLQADGIVGRYDSEAGMAAAIERYTAGEPLVGRPDTRSVILCCTDSRRDACCARYGFATYKALRDAINPARFNLLQATHVGGCRFAASLVVLPQQQRYGRLTPEQVPDFLAALTAGDVYLPAFRGRSGLPETAQLAEHAGMEWAQQRGLPWRDVVLGEGSWPDQGQGADGEEIVREVIAGPARLRLVLQARLAPRHGTCTALAQPPELHPRWYVASLHLLP